MNISLKALITAGIVATFNLNAMADEATSGVPVLQDKEPLTHEEEEAAAGIPTLQNEVERLKLLKPKQLAEEQKAMHEAIQNMTPQQREEQREEMVEELESMSPEERQAMHDKAQTEEEKALAREHIEHSADPQHEAAASKPIQSVTQRKASTAKARSANKRKVRNLSPLP
jgi:dihydroxyacid dehydratase/phosphogluconate dehydratase